MNSLYLTKENKKSLRRQYSIELSVWESNPALAITCTCNTNATHSHRSPYLPLDSNCPSREQSPNEVREAGDVSRPGVFHRRVLCNVFLSSNDLMTKMCSVVC